MFQVMAWCHYGLGDLSISHHCYVFIIYSGPILRCIVMVPLCKLQMPWHQVAIGLAINTHHADSLGHNHGLVQDCRISSALALKMQQSCAKSSVIKDLSMMYRALWDQRHEGATRISQCTRRVAPSALTYPSGPWVPPISQCTIHHA